VSRGEGGPWQTQLFVALTTAQLSVALAVRPSGAWRLGRHAPWVPAAVAASAVLLVAGVYLPGLQGLLGTEPLATAQLGIAAAAGLVPGALVVAGQAVAARVTATGGGVPRSSRPPAGGG
jgi:Ca2+-transporting ATPase